MKNVYSAETLGKNTTIHIVVNDQNNPDGEQITYCGKDKFLSQTSSHNGALTFDGKLKLALSSLYTVMRNIEKTNNKEVKVCKNCLKKLQKTIANIKMKNFAEINWEFEISDEEVFHLSQEKDFFKKDTKEFKTTKKYFNLLKTNYLTNDNGRVIFETFKIKNNSNLFHVLSKNQFKSVQFFDKLFHSKVFKQQLPNVKLNNNIIFDNNFNNASPISLDGILGTIFIRGGVYKQLDNYKEAKRIGKCIVKDLFNDRYNDIVVLEQKGIWSKWFHKYSWLNDGYILLDKRENRVILIAVTDYD